MPGFIGSGGLLGGGGSSDTTTSQHSKLPPYMRDDMKQLFQQAVSLVNRPYQEYGGQTVAGQNFLEGKAIDMAKNNVGIQNQYNNQASNLYQQAADMNIGKVNADMINQQQVQAGQVNNYQRVDPSQVRAQMVNAGQIGSNAINNVKAQNIDMQGGVGGMLQRGALDRYMNPYTQNVTNAATAQMEQARQQALSQIGDQAAMSGAFGGSRQGIAEGVTNAQSAMQQGQLVGQLQSQGFNTALGAMQGDVATKLQASQANQQAGLQASLANQQTGMQTALANLQATQQSKLANQAAGLQAGLANQQTGLQGQLANQAAGLNVSEFNKNLNMQGQLANQQNSYQTQLANQNAQLGMSGQNAANQLALQNNLRMLGGAQQGLGQMAQAEGQADVQGIMGMGQFKQQQTQAQLTDAYNRWQQQRNYPIDMMNSAVSWFSGMPRNTTTYGTSSTSTDPNMMLQTLGMVGLANAFRPAGTYSDKRLKKDVAPTGLKTPQLGIPIKTFRWRGQPDDAPKSVGVIAQDVEKVHPLAVGRSRSGHKTVRYGLL